MKEFLEVKEVIEGTGYLNLRGTVNEEVIKYHKEKGDPTAPVVLLKPTPTRYGIIINDENIKVHEGR